jgi:dihydrofolate reductase
MPRVKFIAAIDNKRGLAKGDENMPWHLPGDLKYFKDKTSGQKVLMGFNTHMSLPGPLPGRDNLVLNSRGADLRKGFISVSNQEITQLLQGEIWVIGGASLFAQLIGRADELYLTQIDADFNCDKFFPEYESSFERVEHTEPSSEAGQKYAFEVWQQKV